MSRSKHSGCPQGRGCRVCRIPAKVAVRAARAISSEDFPDEGLEPEDHDVEIAMAMACYHRELEAEARGEKYACTCPRTDT